VLADNCQSLQNLKRLIFKIGADEPVACTSMKVTLKFLMVRSQSIKISDRLKRLKASSIMTCNEVVHDIEPMRTILVVSEREKRSGRLKVSCGPKARRMALCCIV
jgi:hypothetical protein